MKNQPFSVTGEYVEKLKSTEQNSIQEKDILPYSQYIQNMFKRTGKRYFRSRYTDLVKILFYTKNLLLEYGFTIRDHQFCTRN